jgi:putative sterol carrier protein
MASPDAADTVQALYLAGAKRRPSAAIPDALVDAVALCGPKSRIAEGLERWKAAPINTLILNTFDPSVVGVMAELVLGADAGQPTRTISLPPVAAEPVAEIPMQPKSAAVFEQMAERISHTPAMVERVNAVFQFRISGQPGGDWVVDLKNAPGAVRSGVAERADCTIIMQDDDFVAMTSGKLNAMAAFSQGKIKIQGNMMLATKLQSLFG